MPPRVLVVDPQHPDEGALGEAVAILRRGGLVAIPTETVYGLAGRALDPAALARIYEAKGRPRTHPLIAHVEGEAQAQRLADRWPEAAALLASHFFPGPLTLVVPRASTVPAEIAAGGATVAVRAPSHPIARALLVALGEPLAAPSANRYQSVSPTTAAHVVRGLGDAVELVLDGGACTHGIESTVVDVSVTPPRLLRPGALSIAAIRAVVPDLVVPEEGAVVSASEVRASPGLDARHYAPRAHVEIVEGQDAAFRRAGELAVAGKKVALLVRSPVRRSMLTGLGMSVSILGESPAHYATQLFATLHEADDRGVDVMVVEALPAHEDWFAIRDRLRRARA